MGKEDQEGEEKPTEEKKEQPKKIIKKLPFKALTKFKKGDQEDDLKDWKPIKIADK